MKLLALLICFAGMASAETLALLCAENDATCDGAVAALQATGDFSSVVGFDTTTGTPLLSQISGFDAVLEWTDNTPADGTALGNLLASYYALGGKNLTVASYSFSTGFDIGGAIMTGGYAGLTDSGTFVTPSGNIVAAVAGDRIFNGIDLSAVSYYHAALADPGLAPGATLLATDGAGVDLIARSSLGVIDVNLYPGAVSANNAEFYQLLANTLVPEPTTLGFVGAGFLALIVARRRRKIQS